LPSERALVEQFDISRPTVREALRVAESLGLIEVQPGSPAGPLVTAQYPKGIARIVKALIRGGRATLGHLVEMRMILEGQASFLAALQPSSKTRPLRQALAAFEAAENPKALQAADIAFHEAQGVASGNPLLALVIGALGESIGQSIAVGLPSLGWPDARTTALMRHTAIVEAIEAGRPIEAAHLSRVNLLRTYGPLLPESRSRLEALAGFDLRLKKDPTGRRSKKK
jgi:GntR family transcriptional regulator, transcriptional repressor for pyruvate dehydrogenase complex